MITLNINGVNVRLLHQSKTTVNALISQLIHKHHTAVIMFQSYINNGW